jgi:hypothetical protein
VKPSPERASNGAVLPKARAALPKRSTVLVNPRARLLCHATVLVAQGNVFLCHATVLLKLGASLDGEGPSSGARGQFVGSTRTVLLKPGAVLLKASTVLPRGSTVLPKASTVLPRGSTVLTEGLYRPPKASTVLPRGSTAPGKRSTALSARIHCVFRHRKPLGGPSARPCLDTPRPVRLFCRRCPARPDPSESDRRSPADRQPPALGCRVRHDGRSLPSAPV